MGSMLKTAKEWFIRKTSVGDSSTLTVDVADFEPNTDNNLDDSLTNSFLQPIPNTLGAGVAVVEGDDLVKSSIKHEAPADSKPESIQKFNPHVPIVNTRWARQAKLTNALEAKGIVVADRLAENMDLDLNDRLWYDRMRKTSLNRPDLAKRETTLRKLKEMLDNFDFAGAKLYYELWERHLGSYAKKEYRQHTMIASFRCDLSSSDFKSALQRLENMSNHGISQAYLGILYDEYSRRLLEVKNESKLKPLLAVLRDFKFSEADALNQDIDEKYMSQHGYEKLRNAYLNDKQVGLEPLLAALSEFEFDRADEIFSALDDKYIAQSEYRQRKIIAQLRHSLSKTNFDVAKEDLEAAKSYVSKKEHYLLREEYSRCWNRHKNAKLEALLAALSEFEFDRADEIFSALDDKYIAQSEYRQYEMIAKLEDALSRLDLVGASKLLNQMDHSYITNDKCNKINATEVKRRLRSGDVHYLDPSIGGASQAKFNYAFSFDLYTSESRLSGNGFENDYTVLGQLVHDIKYKWHLDKSQKKNKVEAVFDIIKDKLDDMIIFDNPSLCIAPVPSSSDFPKSIAKLVADTKGLAFRDIFTKSPNAPQSKKLDSDTDFDDESFCMEKMPHKADLLIIDDTYGTGKTLRALLRLAEQDDNVGRVYFLSIVKNRAGGLTHK